MTPAPARPAPTGAGEDRPEAGAVREEAPRPHLIAAIVVILLVLAGLGGGSAYADRVIAAAVHPLAATRFEQRTQGSALQAAAFGQPDLLPTYGSSELVHVYSPGEPYAAGALFSAYPTGFAPFPVAKPGQASLIILEKLAAVGPALRGRKVAISVTYGWFGEPDALGPAAYAANFSPLHAGELAFSVELSDDLKRGAARRMLAYPATLERVPVLNFALERLADDSAWSRLQYVAVLPLGKLQMFWLRMQDRWETLAFIREQGQLPSVARRPAALDWDQLATEAERAYVPFSEGNRFGFHEQLYRALRQRIAREQAGSSDRAFLNFLDQSQQWTDLDLLLRGIEELGGRPLVVILPLHGPYSDWRNISSAARGVYYERIRDVARRHGAAVADFSPYGRDRHFAVDMAQHLAPEGWVRLDEVLDRFYHAAPH